MVISRARELRLTYRAAGPAGTAVLRPPGGCVAGAVPRPAAAGIENGVAPLVALGHRVPDGGLG